MQCPSDRDMQPSAKAHSSCVILPASMSSSQRHTAVPEPTSVPWYLPLSFGPPVTMIAGRSVLAAAISRPGVVLSQPDSSTTPSSGLARISSSASIASRFRYSMDVGRSSVSPSAIAGNSSGKPPACQTPRLTDSATRCRCTLHGASSDQVVAMPITGRPSNTSGVKPWLRIHDRWFIPARPVAANHAALRLTAFIVMALYVVHESARGNTRSSAGRLDSVGEEREPGLRVAGPLRMVHQPERETVGAGDPGDASFGAVRVLPRRVAQRDLPSRPPRTGRRPGDEAAFTVRAREGHRAAAKAGQPRAGVALRHDVRLVRPVLEGSGVIDLQRRATSEAARPQHDLEAVADPDHRAVGAGAELIRQPRAQQERGDRSRSEVVAE